MKAFIDNNPQCIAVLVFLISIVLYIALISEAEINGDCIDYAKIIENKSVDVLPIHFGFYLFGIIFTKILPFKPIISLDLMSSLFGAMSIALIYMITFKITKNSMSSFVGSCAMMFSGLYWLYAMYNEIYTVQVFFISLTYLFWITKKEYLSGLSFVLAMLVSPLSLLCLPGLTIDGLDLKRIWKRVLRFSLCSISLYAIFLAFYFSSLMGSRQYELRAFSYSFFRDISYWGGSFSFTLLLLIIGIMTILVIRGKYIWSLLAFISTFVFHVLAVGGSGYELLIATFPVTAILIGISYNHQVGVYQLEQRGKKQVFILIVVIGTGITLTLLGVIFYLPRLKEYIIKFLGDYDSTLFPLVPVVAAAAGILSIFMFKKYKNDKVKRWEAICGISTISILFFTALFSASVFILPIVREKNNFRDFCLEFEKSRNKDSVIIASFTSHRLYGYYTANEENLILLDALQTSEVKEAIDNNLNEFSEVWLIGKYGRRDLEEQLNEIDKYNIHEVNFSHGMAWLLDHAK